MYVGENTSNGHCTFKFSSECFSETYLKAREEHMSFMGGGGGGGGKGLVASDFLCVSYTK